MVIATPNCGVDSVVRLIVFAELLTTTIVPEMSVPAGTLVLRNSIRVAR